MGTQINTQNESSQKTVKWLRSSIAQGCQASPGHVEDTGIRDSPAPSTSLGRSTDAVPSSFEEPANKYTMHMNVG